MASFFDRLFVSNILYWEKRASRYGVRSALNIGHTYNELESVLALQEEAIFPHLKHSLNGDEKTILDFCAIFARYFKKNNVWIRNPFVFIKKGIDAAKSNSWNTPHGDVKIKLVSRRMKDGNFHVSLFLVNATDAKKRKRLDHSHYVFQPHIRVNLADYG